MNSVEINGSFYSLQSPASHQRWHEETPEDFVFAVKGSRFISHMKKLSGVRVPVANLLASGVLRLERKLEPILWPLSPRFVFAAEKIAASVDAKVPAAAAAAAEGYHHRVQAARLHGGAHCLREMAMENPRIDWLHKQVESNPNDPRLRFGLALEYEKLGRWGQVVDELREYLALAEDQGNAWGRLARALGELGRDAEAREAYRRGIEAARSHGHPGMAAEFEELLDDAGH